jgi:hypothetical protein
MAFDIELASQEVLSRINKDLHLRKFVDHALPIPRVFRGTGTIKLIIVGQDPTVRNPLRRKQIDMVLDLNKSDGHIRGYINEISTGLQISLEQNVYATNFYKNFFVDPPTEINKTDIFDEFSGYWLPLLKSEIEQFPLAPIITLGEPILKPLLHKGQEYQVRHYWGYSIDRREGERPEFKHIKPEANHLGRTIFPFPHQPSTTKDFYKCTMASYIDYVKSEGFRPPQIY